MLEAECFQEREREKSTLTAFLKADLRHPNLKPDTAKLAPKSKQKLGLRTAASSCGAVTARGYQDTEPDFEFCHWKALKNDMFSF